MRTPALRLLAKVYPSISAAAILIRHRTEGIHKGRRVLSEAVPGWEQKKAEAKTRAPDVAIRCSLTLDTSQVLRQKQIIEGQQRLGSSRSWFRCRLQLGSRCAQRHLLSRRSPCCRSILALPESQRQQNRYWSSGCRRSSELKPKNNRSWCRWPEQRQRCKTPHWSGRW